MKRLTSFFFFFFFATAISLYAPPMSESLNNIPTASSMAGTEQFVVIQNNFGKKASMSLVRGVLQPFDVELLQISNLSNPGEDRILFWDSSLGSGGGFAWLTPGSNLSIVGTTINATGGGGSGGGTWGGIVGILSDQADLQTALDAKALASLTLEIAGTPNEIQSSAGAQTLGSPRIWTIGFPSIIDLGGKTSLTIPHGVAPVVDSPGKIAQDDNLWGAGRGTIIFYDGTEPIGVVGTKVSDTPIEGQVPVWHPTGSTWETLTATPGGGNTELQWNNAGVTAGTTGMTWNNALGILTIPSISTPLLNVTTFLVRDLVDQSHGYTFVVESDLIANKEFRIIGTSNVKFRFPGDTDLTFPPSGTVATLADIVGGGGATTWTAIGDSTANTSIALAGFTTDWSSSLDSAGAFIWTITNTDADSGAATGFLQFKHNDGADADVVYLKFVGDADGSPVNDYLLTQTVFTIGSGIATTFGGPVAVANLNKVTVTPPATSSTLTIVDGKTLNVSQDTVLNRQASTGLPVEIQIVCSDTSTPITAGTNKGYVRSPFPFTLTEARASVFVAPTGSTILINVKETGTTVLGNKIMIDATEFTSQTAATAYTITDSAIADDAVIAVDFDQVGATVPGAWVIVTLKGYR